mgnify:FL=1
MAALGSQSIASSYEQLLHVDRDGGGNTTTHVSIKDGDNGTTFGFTIASDALMMTSTNRLEFGDTGTYIHQSADGVLDLVSDTEIELTATTIDLNGAVAMDGAMTGGTNITISGELDAATLDISGNADIDGTLEADAITVNGTALATFIRDTVGTNMLSSNSESGITVTYDTTNDNIDFAVDAAQTGITSLLAADIKIGEDNETKIDFEDVNEIHFYANNVEQVYVADNIFGPNADSDVDLGTTGVRWKDAFVDSITVTGEIDGASLDIEGNADINGTTNLDAVDIDGEVQIDNTVTVGADDQGYDVIFYGDTASSNMTWDTSGDDLILNDSRLYIDQDDDERSLEIVQDGNAQAIFVDQNANQKAINVDSESTTSNVIGIDADALTTGNALSVSSASSSNGTRNLVNIKNENAGATGTTALKIQQDAAAHAMLIDQNANDYALEIASDGTTATTFEVGSNSLTTGTISHFYSASADNSTRNLVKITNDHASADNAVGLYIQQDGADASIELAGNGSIKFPGTQGASADANSLDDYEEGTYTATVTPASGSITIDGSADSLSYTKIGDMCHVQGRIEVSATSSASGATNLNLPFTSSNLTDDAGNSTSVNLCYLNGSAITDGTFLTMSHISEGTALCRIFFIDAGTSTTENLGDDHIDDGSSIYVNLHYKCA